MATLAFSDLFRFKTMKLNAAALMQPLSLAGPNIHPSPGRPGARDYRDSIAGLEQDLATITGFAACSLQPNSGAAGEYTGLMVIRAYHQSRGQGYRNVVLIPHRPTAEGRLGGHGRHEDRDGGVRRARQHRCSGPQAKAKEHSSVGTVRPGWSTQPLDARRSLGEPIRECVDAVHDAGGQVYMDGANMNAQVGLTNPGCIPADVRHPQPPQDSAPCPTAAAARA